MKSQSGKWLAYKDSNCVCMPHKDIKVSHDHAYLFSLNLVEGEKTAGFLGLTLTASPTKLVSSVRKLVLIKRKAEKMAQ